MIQQDASGTAVAGGDELVGTLVAGRYRIARKVGEGGMGTVYQAVHEALRKPVALKLLSGRGSSDKETVARFEREAVAAANLRHPNIAEATDFGRLPDGAFYLVMEYVEGKTLRGLLDASPAGLPPPRVLPILRQVAAALACAHAAEIVHRDLKPENVIVIDRADARDVVKVIDFGIARIRSATFGLAGTALTAVGAVFGTPEYMAPEQVMGKVADARADQYAFGVTAFELLTGQVPYTGAEMGQILMKHVNAPIPDASAASPHLPAAVGRVLSKLLAKRPEDRFPTIEAAHQALEAAFAAPASGGTVRMDWPASASSSGRFAVSSPAVDPGRPSGAAAGYGVSPAMTAPPAPAMTSPPSPAMTAPPGAVGTRGPSGPGPLASLKAQLATHGVNPVVLAGIVSACGLLLVLVGVIVVWSAKGSSLPGEVGDALDRWEGGAYEEAEPALKAGLIASPALANDPALHEPLVATVREDRARPPLLRLLNTTALGRSAKMAAALAGIALEEPSATRNGALKLLRGRLDLLPAEPRARVALRDADDCPSLEKAVRDLAGAGPQADTDAKSYREGQCRKLLRREELCGCPPPVPARIRGKKGGRP